MQNKTLVMKFGGTSVGSVEALVNATQIIRDAKKDWSRIVVVTSAMSGVTNLLLDSASSNVGARSSRPILGGETPPLRDIETQLREKHFSAAQALIKNKSLLEETKKEINSLIQVFVNLCNAIQILGEASPRALDAVASLGERMSLRLLTAVVNEAGIKAKGIESTKFIFTNSNFQNAHPDFLTTKEKTQAILNPILDEGNVVITTGFIGANT